MWWLQKVSEGRKELMAFVCSSALHASLAASLLFSDSTIKKNTQDISVDLVTLEDFNPNAQNRAHVPRQKRQDKAAKETIPNETSAIADSRKDNTDKDLKAEVAVGESNIESSFRGRPPNNETERYLSEIRDQIARQQIYPTPSRSFREEGTVRIRLTLNRSGSVVKIELMEASLYKRLNDAAMRAATKAAPFKPFPTEVRFETWKITLPIRFTLAKN